MKHCNLCGVDVDTSKNYCPLCYGTLEEKSKKTDEEMFNTASKPVISRKKSMVLKIFLMISIIIMTACVYINVQTKTAPWSVIVGLSIFYLWVLVAHTIMSRSTPFKKMFMQLLSLAAILFATERFFGNTHWFTNYAFPGIAMLATFVTLFVEFCSKKRKEYVFGFFRIYILLILASVLLLVLKADGFKLINQINIIFQSVICFAYLVFAGKTIRTQASRKFHL